MKKNIRYIVYSILMYILVGPLAVSAQTKFETIGGVKIVIEGTSNIHDWKMNSEKGSCSIVADQASGTLNGISNLSFSINPTTIKSESKAMDKNAYKALNTDKFPSISFTANAVTVKPNGGSAYTVAAKGRLTISGVTKPVLLTAIATLNPDKSVSYTGSYKLKMTDFEVEPPSIMFGAIKTGDDIVVKFNVVLKEAALTSLKN